MRGTVAKILNHHFNRTESMTDDKGRDVKRRAFKKLWRTIPRRERHVELERMRLPTHGLPRTRSSIP